MTKSAFVSISVPCVRETENRLGIYERTAAEEWVYLRVPVDVLSLFNSSQTEWWWWPSLNDALPYGFQPYTFKGGSISPYSFRVRAKLYGEIHKDPLTRRIDLCGCDREEAI